MFQLHFKMYFLPVNILRVTSDRFRVETMDIIPDYRGSQTLIVGMLETIMFLFTLLTRNNVIMINV